MRSMSEAISLRLVSLLSIELFAPISVPIVQTPSCILPRIAGEEIEPAPDFDPGWGFKRLEQLKRFELRFLQPLPHALHPLLTTLQIRINPENGAPPSAPAASSMR